MALVEIGGNSPFCGGTLISSRHVLSAAHCTRAIPNFHVVAGEHDFGDDNDGTSYAVEFYYEHPAYDSYTMSHDFVVITLADSVTLGDVAVHACLPTEEMDDNYLSGSILTVSGWGRLSEYGDSPLELQTVDVPFIPNTVCNEAYSEFDFVTINEAMICAGNLAEGGVGSCYGDSGGKIYS